MGTARSYGVNMDTINAALRDGQAKIEAAAVPSKRGPLAAPYVCVTVPVKTKNPTNGREQWYVVARRAKKEHEAVFAALFPVVDEATRLAFAAGCTVTLTRCSAGTFDDDGLRAALKHVRDAVAVKLFGGKIGQRDSGGHVTWEYRQLKTGRGVAGVVVSIRAWET